MGGASARTSTGRPSVAIADALAAGLRARRGEIENAIRTRIYAIADPHDVADPSYIQGLSGAIEAAVGYRLAVVESGQRRAPAIPTALLAQARLDGRDGVALDTVLRRYFAGATIFGDFLVDEAERASLTSSAIRPLLAAQATLGDRLLAAVSAEHGRAAAAWPRSAADRRRECVKSLLAGELVDHSNLAYELGGHHVGLLARGDEAPGEVRELAARLECRVLAVCREEEPVWACWLGSGEAVRPEELSRALESLDGDEVVVGVGEPAAGLAGWRVSHRQAKAALRVAERRGGAVVRYADVAILASVLEDDLAADSLRRIYLQPLDRLRGGGEAARQTLRTYLAVDRNVSSTAAALGIDRRTVTNRLRAIEGALRRPLTGDVAGLGIALELDLCSEER